MDNLELVKENVLPLKNGRKIDSLKAALSVDSIDSTKREETRLQFEKDIQLLVDDKLLEVYYNYISFIEQNYPNGGKEANLNTILEKCIQTFYNKEEFKNDQKLLSIFIKYTNNVNNPLSVFDFFFKIGFAKKLAQFYISWSYYLETQSNFKKALKVINAGIKNEAEPIAELKSTLNDLQVRTMRFVNSNDEESTNSQRKALNNLKTKRHDGKVNAPVKRYGNSIKDNNTGLKTVTEKNVPKPNNEQLQIYTDDNEEPTTFTPKPTKFMDCNEENEKTLDKWAENKLNLKKVPAKPFNNFVIHIDSNDKEPKVEKVKTEIAKSEPNWPVVKFESKEMLAKYIWYNQIEQIYKESAEFSFEEIRYEKWLLNRQNDNEKNCNADDEQSNASKSSIIDQTCKEATCSMVRGFFNGTIAATTVVEDFNQTNINKCNTKNQNFEIFESSSYPIEKQPENSQITEKEREDKDLAISDFTISVIKSDDFRTCSSSTPFINKTFKRPSNVTMKYCNNPNFVNGITAKLLSPIIETSREFNSKSSSSSSGTNSSTSTAVNHSQKKTLIYSDNIDPFDTNFKSLLLRSLSEPVESRKGFSNIQKPLPSIKYGMNLNICNDCYLVEKQIFESKLCSAFKVIKEKSSVLNQNLVDIDYKIYSLKLYRKLNYWQFYICDELDRRLAQKKDNPDIELSVTSISEIVFYNDGYLLINDLATNGTLLNAIMKFEKTLTKFPQTLMSCFILELMLIIKQIHKCRIIHADINPENILIFNIDDVELLPKRTSALKLINFDKAIDLELFPEETAFNRNYNKNEQIYEILDDKNWTFQIDWIGFLNCVHWMAFGTRMHVIQECGNSKWKIDKTFDNTENNYLNGLFDLLLNLDCNQEPDLDGYIKQLSTEVKSNEMDLRKSFSTLHIQCFECNFN